MITDAVFTTELMKSEIRHLRPELLYPFQNRRSLLTTLQIDRSNPLLILFFGELLIEDAELLLVQTNTSEAVATPEAIFAELALSTIGTVLSVINHVAVCAVCALGAPLAPEAECKPATADTFPGVTSVVHVLRVEDAKAVITILATDRFCKVAVLCTVLNEVVPWPMQKKILKFTDEIHRIGGQRRDVDADHSLGFVSIFVKKDITFRSSFNGLKRGFSLAVNKIQDYYIV